MIWYSLRLPITQSSIVLFLFSSLFFFSLCRSRFFRPFLFIVLWLDRPASTLAPCCALPFGALPVLPFFSFGLVSC